jgi:hypothetical protein
MEKTKPLKCARCKKTVEVPLSWLQKCCPECLLNQKAKYRKNRIFNPSKEDNEARERIRLEHLQEQASKYGTEKEDCIKFRRLAEEKDYSAFWFQHLENCLSCRKWRESKKFDLNATEKRYEELRGFEEAFKSTEKQQEMEDITSENDEDILDALGRKEK